MPENLIFTPLQVRVPEKRVPILTLDVYERRRSPFTSSQILFATTQTGDHVAIKFSRIPQGPNREWIGLQRAYDYGVSVPEPIELIRDSQGHLGIVSQKIEGINLYQNQDPELKKRFGESVRRMHDLVSIEGREWRESGRADFTYYDQNITHWRSLDYEVIRQGSRGSELLKRFAFAIQDDLRQRVPVFTHRDLHNDQAYITPEGKLYMIDFELWRESNPFDDLAIYLLHTLRTNQPTSDFVEFVRGYTENGRCTDEEKSLIAFFLLFAGGRGIDYFSRFRPHEISSAISQMHKITDYIDKEQLWRDLP